MPTKKPEQEAFAEWLREQGADVLQPTSDYEFARFRAMGMINIIYVRQSGAFSAQPFGMECLAAFRKKKNMAMGFTEARKSLNASMRATLLARDGDLCFFCAEAMPPWDVTIEHLVAKNKGGPDHTDNLVLAHEACNQRIGSMPLIRKIRIYHEARKKKEGPHGFRLPDIQHAHGPKPEAGIQPAAALPVGKVPAGADGVQGGPPAGPG